MTKPKAKGKGARQDPKREPPLCDKCGTETVLKAEDVDAEQRGYECPRPACGGRRFLRTGPKP